MRLAMVAVAGWPSWQLHSSTRTPERMRRSSTAPGKRLPSRWTARRAQGAGREDLP